MITLSFIYDNMHCTHFIAIFRNIEKGASYPIESIKRSPPGGGGASYPVIIGISYLVLK